MKNNFFLKLFLILTITATINACSNKSGFQRKGSASYPKITGLVNSSMYASKNTKKDYQQVQVIPNSLLVWLPKTQTNGSLYVFDTVRTYKMAPVEKAKFKLEYKIENNSILLTQDKEKWYPLIIESIEKEEVIVLSNGKKHPSAVAVLKCNEWINSEYEMIWDDALTLKDQIEFVNKTYSGFID